MRKFALFLTVLCLFALATAVEASLQIEPTDLRPFCPSQDASGAVGIVPAEDGELGFSATSCSLDMPALAIDAYVGFVPRGQLTLDDLAGTAGSQRQTLPEPATIAVWSLIGLCWGGVRCWQNARSPAHDAGGWDRAPAQRRMSRPPWPDHVRARILEIIERGAPR
jgi:hypothetical protein